MNELVLINRTKYSTNMKEITPIILELFGGTNSKS